MRGGPDVKEKVTTMRLINNDHLVLQIDPQRLPSRFLEEEVVGECYEL